MVEYKCPKCGSDVKVEMVLTNPPITCYKCTKCEYHKDEHQRQDKSIVIAPL